MDYEKKLRDYARTKVDLAIKNDEIPGHLFNDLGVYRGLRDEKGKGVLTGLTSISRIDAFEIQNGQRVPIDGRLYYRQYEISDLVHRCAESGFGFEKASYLLMFGEMPTEDEAEEFIEMLSRYRHLPQNFTRDIIMKAPTQDIMNSMTRSILTLASYDPAGTQTDLDITIRQSL
ncbi:MAG: citrate synthase, partial [Lachnospiraceae bacterium]|nr:citrate synthase [Candidatus Equihabitans merdae]